MSPTPFIHVMIAMRSTKQVEQYTMIRILGNKQFWCKILKAGPTDLK